MRTKSSVIASNAQELKKFIFDLCAFSLEKAGFEPALYGFYLHVAFRHQVIKQEKNWKAIATAVSEKNPLVWSRCNQVLLHHKIEVFAADIVEEVQMAEEDNWAIKLIKTSYLSYLDSAKKSADRAIKLLNTEDWSNLASLSLTELTLHQDATIHYYTTVLENYGAYLDALIDLPFVLEEFCISLAHNKKINYQPRKTAAMLSKVLSVLSEGFDRDYSFLVQGLSIGLELVLPDLPIDTVLRKKMEKRLVPFLSKIIHLAKKSEAEQEQLFAGDEGKAKQELLAIMGVECDSIQTLLSKTLLEPVLACTKVATELEALTFAGYDCDIPALFATFDSIATELSTKESLMPAWLQKTNSYYQALKAKKLPENFSKGTVFTGLGVFYQYAGSLIPEVLLNYLNGQNHFSELLGASNKALDIDIIWVYFDFFEWAYKAGIKDPIKEKFFKVYQAEVFKKYEKFSLKNVHYEGYKKLEHQLLEKNIDLEQNLQERIERFDAFSPLSSSFLEPLKTLFSIENSQQWELFLLVNRVKKLEKEFDHKKAGISFEELVAAKQQLQKHTDPRLRFFEEHFLKSATLRLITDYKNEYLLPWLEAFIDEQEGKYALKHKLKNIYSKWNQGAIWHSSVGLTDIEWEALESVWTDKHFRFDHFVFIAKTMFPLDIEAHFEKKETAKQRQVSAWKTATEDYIIPAISALFMEVQKILTKQEQWCFNLLALSSDKTLRKIVRAKKNYIDALNGVINEALDRMEHQNETLSLVLLSLLRGKQPDFLSSVDLSTGAVAKQLMQCAWHVLPAHQNLNESLVTNLFHYLFKDGVIKDAILAKAAYQQAYLSGTYPALTEFLHDPLDLNHLFPKQEELLDLIIDKLLAYGSRSIFAWGADYLKQLRADVQGLLYTNLVQLIPYPLFVKLFLQILESPSIQAKLAPFFHKVFDQYGQGAVAQIHEMRAYLKNKLYPLLGVELQKTIEISAYRYMENPEAASAIERDAFAFLYLKYFEMQTSLDEQAVQLLFPTLLSRLPSKEYQQKQSVILNAFQATASFLGPQEHIQNVQSLKKQVQSLVHTMDFENPHLETLFLQVALFSRLLMLIMDTAKSYPDKQIQEDLERLALSEFITMQAKLSVFNADFHADEVDSQDDLGASQFVLVDAAIAEKYQRKVQCDETIAREHLAKAHAVLSVVQHAKVTKKLNTFYAEVDRALQDREEMLEAGDKFFGLSLMQWDYQQSSPTKRFFLGLYSAWNICSFVLAWMAVLTPILASAGYLQTILAFFGATAAVGTAATGIGLIVFVSIAILRFFTKCIQEIWEQRRIFDAINDESKNPSLLKRIGLNILLVLKCMAYAAIKTIFSDYIVAKIIALFPVQSMKKINGALKTWPSKVVITDEKTTLEQLKKMLSKLKNALAKNTDMTALLFEIQTQIAHTEAVLARADTARDARFERCHYQDKLALLRAEAKQLLVDLEHLTAISEPLASQKKAHLYALEPLQESSSNSTKINEKRSVVSIQIYRQKWRKSQKIAAAEMGFFNQLMSPIWTYLYGSNEVMEESIEVVADEFTESALSSSFLMLEENPQPAAIESPLTGSLSASFYVVQLHEHNIAPQTEDLDKHNFCSNLG